MAERCEWCRGDPLYEAYHDQEWGYPQRDPGTLFEFLILEGAQAGLSWITILRKRDAYREAFSDFDPARVAAYGKRDVNRLMKNEGIVRNRLKIESAVRNARAWLELDDPAAWLWSFVDGAPVQHRFKTMAEVPALRRPDDLPEAERARLRHDLRGVLLRHAWAADGHGPLLAKNALAAGRLHLYREVAPDMRVIVLLRHPYEAIPSMVSMFSRPWRFFQPDWEHDEAHLRRIAELGCEYYRAVDAFARELPEEQVVELYYDDLIADPEAAVAGIYDRFGLTLSPEFAAQLHAEATRARSYRSRHRYDLEAMGLSEAWIRERLGGVFERRRFAA